MKLVLLHQRLALAGLSALCVCRHSPRQERWQFAATGTAVQTEETAPHRGANMTMQKRGSMLIDAKLFLGELCSKSDAPVQVTAAATLHGWTLLCLFLTVWHFDHILACFKALLPFHVWSPQVLCCFMTPAVQRRRLRHPHIYTDSSNTLWDLLSCAQIYLTALHKADVHFCKTPECLLTNYSHQLMTTCFSCIEKCLVPLLWCFLLCWEIPGKCIDFCQIR